MNAVAATAPPRDEWATALRATMARALVGAGDLEAVACVDLRNGAVLADAVRDDDARDVLELATHAAPLLCTAPRLDAAMGDDVRAREAVVVSESAVHAFARSSRHPDLVVVGVARAGANVALLLASVRAMADAMGEDLR